MTKGITGIWGLQSGPSLACDIVESRLCTDVSVQFLSCKGSGEYQLGLDEQPKHWEDDFVIAKLSMFVNPGKQYYSSDRQ